LNITLYANEFKVLCLPEWISSQTGGYMLQLLTLRNRRHSNVDISDGIMFISSRALLSGLLKWLAFRSIIKNEGLCLSSGVVESTMIGKINWRQGERGRLQLPHKSVR
jgi:hypothetical protein